MSGLVPVNVYGLKVPTGDFPIPAAPDFPATIRITMAAIDPSASPQLDNVADGATPRATLKILRQHVEDEEDEDYDEDDDSIEAIKARLAGVISDESDEESDEEEAEANGGPSDPAKSKKARKEAALKEILADLQNQDGMDIDSPKNKSKGKKKAADKEEESDESSDEEEDDYEGEVEEFVLCTLDPAKHYQQPLEITIGEDERVYFQVSGTHDVYLTGNYVIPAHDHDHDEDDYDSEDDEDYDLSPDEDELYDDEESEDALDDLQDPRIEELPSDEEEEAPKLIKADAKADEKKNKKRPAEESEEDATLDEQISKSKAAAGEKLSKKQQKKLKTNEGKAVPAEEPKKEAKTDKKVQFAKNLEMGPTGSPKVDSKTDTKKDEKPKAALGVKVVNGVKIDDKKLGTGPAAKKGDRIGMRYIGKLEKDGKVFDSNKKGKPFTFKLGAGEVIKGWDIGVAGMCVGGERRITIPPQHAYGSQKIPGIPPNSTLVFDIKMISLN